jgi:hypothetical protein
MVRQYAFQTQRDRNPQKLEADVFGDQLDAATRHTQCFYFDSVITVAGDTIVAISARKVCIFPGQSSSIRIQCRGMDEDSA